VRVPRPESAARALFFCHIRPRRRRYYEQGVQRGVYYFASGMHCGSKAGSGPDLDHIAYTKHNDEKRLGVFCP